VNKEILCTLGPSSLNDHVVARLESLGVSLFRINLSHTRLDELPGIIRYLQKATRVPICLDTEGAQVRTGTMADGKALIREHTLVKAHRGAVQGSASDLNLYPEDIIDKLEDDDFLTLDFDSALLQVVEKHADHVVLRALHGGSVGSNKAVTVERDISLPAMTAKDRKALALGAEMGLRHAALSFAHRASDVDELRAVFGKDAFVISKIECRDGLENLEEIARRSDALLIDRGDLSRELPLERIPRAQKTIINRGKALGVKVYVATNLMESMTRSPNPTRAEVNDVFNTLADGADGLVLAAETAIGAYPVRCADMVAKIIREHSIDEEGGDGLSSELLSELTPPHGGRLVHGMAHGVDAAELGRLKPLRVRDTDLMDCEQIALGTYSPITGFMDRETLRGVLEEYRLKDGTPWTLPIVLQVGRDETSGIGRGERLRLEDSEGRARALLDVRDVYPVDMEAVARKWFGTASPEHPGVARLSAGGAFFVAGEVTLLERRPSPHRPYELTPSQSRYIFAHKGWRRVVGFHTRNVIHRVHEHIQLKALETVHADGLYITPVIGPKKPGDFLPGPIMKSYQLMLDSGLYPDGKVLVGSFATYSRYCGPREAVFTALCRKNMGCSHFIIGRDHTGVADFYRPEDNQRLFERLGDLGVTPIFFGAVGYDPQARAYGSLSGKGGEQISGTQVREALREGRPLPEWFMRGPIQEMLRRELAAGRPVFQG
jgi:ATP sulfurylase